MAAFLVRVMPWVLLTGAVAWIVKVVAIVGNGGDNTDEGVVGLLYVVGLAGLVFGVTAIGGWVSLARPTWLTVVAAVASIPIFFVSYAVLDAVAKATIGDAGGEYMRQEHGIWLTGLLWAVAAGWLLFGSRRRLAGQLE